MPSQRKLLWKYSRRTLRISIQFQNQCRRLGISCVIPKRPHSNGFSLVASPMMIMIFLGHQQLGTSLYGVHTGDLSKGPLEAQSSSHRKFALQGGCRQLEGRRKDDECDLRMLRNSCVIPQGDAVRSHHI